jgi:ribosomal protein S18 acetylase RimI-like enzyme
MLQIRKIIPSDTEWVRDLLRRHWGSSAVISRGRVRQADRSRGYVAMDQGERVGLITYEIDGNECEILTLNSERENYGVGTALLRAAESDACEAGCREVRLVTTNDNSKALKFYQKRGYRLKALRPEAIKQYRLLKPEIPIAGFDGIPIRDEIELGKQLLQITQEAVAE